MLNIKFFLIIIFISFSILLVSDFFLGNKIIEYNKNKQFKNIPVNKILPTKKKYLYEYNFKENFDGIIYYSLYDYHLCTNNLSMRIDCKNKKIHNNNYDYIFIGDSFTEGVGLNYNDTFVGIFEKNLSNKDIGNLAISDYSPRNYYHKIKEYILNGLVFNELIVFLDISDIFDEAVKASELIEKGTVYKIDVNENSSNNNLLIKIIKGSFKKYFPLSHYALYRIKHFNLPQPIYRYLPNYQSSSWTYDRSISDYDVESGIELSLEYMNKLYELLNKNNIKLSLAIYPWPNQLIYDNINSEQVKIWENFCKFKCNKFINYFPIFFENKETLNLSQAKKIIKNLYLKNDVHFNKKGNKIIVSHLLKFYKKFN